MTDLALMSLRPAASRAGFRWRSLVGQAWRYGCLVVLLAVIVFPIYWLVLNSLKHQRDFFTGPPIYFTTDLTLSHWQEALGNPLNQKYLLNTAIVTAVSTVLATLAGTLCAYVLARIRLPFRLNRVLLISILIARLFPPVSLAIPYYLLMRQLGLLDTLPALVIAYTGLALPFVTWLMLTFFQDLPREIERAAMVDGCTMFQRFRWIVLPMSLSSMMVTAIFVFMGVWNELLYSLTLTSLSAKTIPVAIASFVGDNALAWGQMSALSIASFVPILLMALTVQRYLVRGITFGAVKG
ncbi:MAG: carbohydrate ABC transporter permease [Devosia nanyangense]|uniref:Carbohydrate ABC transporter permease n=1 Tax=Devosia nanyangense TaxID=1228055 RepID=A0A933L317_9HYPH|nr:carbohydrate ABC transporter permease [Devosia nanyangense]